MIVKRAVTPSTASEKRLSDPLLRKLDLGEFP